MLLTRRTQVSSKRTYAYSANDKQEINDPTPPKKVPNVSKTNELPMETPHRDAPVQEYVDEAEKFRVMQAPNRRDVWSRSQNPRANAMSGPRFEQTLITFQVIIPWCPVRPRTSEPSLTVTLNSFKVNCCLKRAKLTCLNSPLPSPRLSLSISSLSDGVTKKSLNVMVAADLWAILGFLSMLISQKYAPVHTAVCHMLVLEVS